MDRKQFVFLVRDHLIISHRRDWNVTSPQLMKYEREFDGFIESALAFCGSLCQLTAGVFETTYKKKELQNAFR